MVMIPFRSMRDLLILAVDLPVTFAKLLRRGGVRAVATESLLLKRQLLISNRSRERAPNLTTLDRFVLGLTALFVSPRRIAKLGSLVKPATLFKFHRALTDRKYRLLFSSSSHRGKPGPKGPSAEFIAAAHLTAPRRRERPADHRHRPPVLLFTDMPGTSIVAVCFTPQFQPKYEFATDRSQQRPNSVN
jgi:hypothetical protein